MNPSSAAVQPHPRAIRRAIVLGGLVAGIGDLVFAILYFSPAPAMRILQSIAAGLIGKEAAYTGGVATASLGVLLHFLIATGAAAAFVIASRWWNALLRFPGPAGLGYGVAVYFAMAFVVVPLSRVAGQRYPPLIDGGSVVGHMVVVGLPIALIARWCLYRTASSD